MVWKTIIYHYKRIIKNKKFHLIINIKHKNHFLINIKYPYIDQTKKILLFITIFLSSNVHIYKHNITRKNNRTI
jgi:uncharacterized Fe-S cluster-containing protein